MRLDFSYSFITANITLKIRIWISDNQIKKINKIWWQYIYLLISCFEIYHYSSLEFIRESYTNIWTCLRGKRGNYRYSQITNMTMAWNRVRECGTVSCHHPKRNECLEYSSVRKTWSRQLNSNLNCCFCLSLKLFPKVSLQNQSIF